MPNRHIVSQRVMVETGRGSKLIECELSDEARKGLTIHVSDPTSYRHTVREGDRVRLPDGRSGTVHMIEHLPGCVHGHAIRNRPQACPDLVKIVSVRPDRPRRRFILWHEHPVRFAESEINTLELLVSDEEIRRIMNDPTILGLEP